MRVVNSAAAATIRGTMAAMNVLQAVRHRYRVPMTWWQHNLRYQGDRDDLFIVSYARSGTSLMQMLVYQLTTDGNIDKLSHISDVSPYLEVELGRSIESTNITIDMLPRPHVFKSHLDYRYIPKGPGRYIYVVRHGLDVALSHYHMRFSGRQGPSFEEFFLTAFAGPRGRAPFPRWFDHVAGWYANRKKLDVLYVTYDGLVTDFASTARRVMAFIGAEVSDAEWPRIGERCSFAFMRQHENKFDESRRLPKEHFMRKGQVGEWRTVPSDDVLRVYRTKCQLAMAGLCVPPEILGPADAVARTGSGGIGAPRKLEEIRTESTAART